MCKNIIYECSRFTKQNHLTNESVEQFITEVHRLGNSCKFAEHVLGAAVALENDHNPLLAASVRSKEFELTTSMRAQV